MSGGLIFASTVHMLNWTTLWCGCKEPHTQQTHLLCGVWRFCGQHFTGVSLMPLNLLVVVWLTDAVHAEERNRLFGDSVLRLCRRAAPACSLTAMVAGPPNVSCTTLPLDRSWPTDRLISSHALVWRPRVSNSSSVHQLTALLLVARPS